MPKGRDTFGKPKRQRWCPDHDAFGCPVERENRVDGRGPVPCHIMLIGEAPGATEDMKGIPFIGKSGSELDNLYLRQCAKVYRENIYITNLVKCRTNGSDRDPNAAEIEACTKVLSNELYQVNPTYVGTIGRLATQWFLGDMQMSKVHGFGYRIAWGLLDFTVMPLYHPAFGLHNTPMMRHIMEDFTRFGKLVRGDRSVLWQSAKTT